MITELIIGHVLALLFAWVVIFRLKNLSKEHNSLMLVIPSDMASQLPLALASSKFVRDKK